MITEGFAESLRPQNACGAPEVNRTSARTSTVEVKESQFDKSQKQEQTPNASIPALGVIQFVLKL